MAAGNQLMLMTKGRERAEEDECPLCNLPLPLDEEQSMFKVCCMKLVCYGCSLASRKRGMRDCPFCRTPTPDEGQGLAMIQKRVDAGDPVAILHLGSSYHYGQHSLEKDVARAVELYELAAELGVKDAHYNLGVLYHEGTDVTDVEKDSAKAICHWEAAAMRGHVQARFNLGVEGGRAGNRDIALQHFLIGVNLGDQDSLGIVKKIFMRSGIGSYVKVS